MSRVQIDLNLLVAFQQVYKDRSISQAAISLGVSQPVLSRSIQRLRGQLKDDLFVRVGNRMEPTCYATELAEPISQSLDTIYASLSQRSDFEPSRDERQFTIAMTEIGEIYFLPQLLPALQEIAPKVILNTVRNSPASIVNDLESGQIQLAVGHLPGLRETLFHRLLFTQDYVCMFRNEHPLMYKALEPREYIGLQQVVVTSAAGHDQMECLWRQLGFHLNIAAQVSDFFAVGSILRNTDLVAIVPQRLAEYFAANQGLKFIKPPITLPSISVHIFWHQRTRQDPGNRWLRNFIIQRFGDGCV